jgi:branched-chain amino acid transport system ATP-binding protein
VLIVSDLHVRRGSTPALRGVDLSVGTGELVALVGPNGAGKSSLLRAIVGLEAPVSGRIAFRGTDLPPGKPLMAARAGISLVPEGRRIFGALTVRENLLLGARTRTDRHVAEDVERWATRFAVLGERMDGAAGALSGGQQQMLAIARALMARPSLLLLDEPSLGLAPMVIDEVFSVLDELHASGLSILLVEQAARRAVSVSDRAYVLAHGEVQATGSSASLVHDDLLDAYFGVTP